MKSFKTFLEGGKLFGLAASRINNHELHLVFNELKKSIGDLFLKFELTKTLESKQDHGDVDILVLAKPDLDIKKVVSERLGKNLLQYSKNDYTHSVLFNSEIISKQVHIDLISSTTAVAHDNKQAYYSLNDFSAAIGTVSKKLHFKYGSEGVFKRFQDQKTIWHDLPLSISLMDGLKILGFDLNLYGNIKNPDDIINFIASNPLVDGSFFEHDVLTAADRQAVNKRPIMDYIINSLRAKKLVRKISDEDHFFKRYYPEIYQKIEQKKQEINNNTYKQSAVFNGNWLMQNFGIKAGPKVGEILKKLSQRFGANLEKTDPEVVRAYAQEVING